MMNFRILKYTEVETDKDTLLKVVRGYLTVEDWVKRFKCIWDGAYFYELDKPISDFKDKVVIYNNTAIGRTYTKNRFFLITNPSWSEMLMRVNFGIYTITMKNDKLYLIGDDEKENK